jgi:hypothetical protein
MKALPIWLITITTLMSNLSFSETLSVDDMVQNYLKNERKCRIETGVDCEDAVTNVTDHMLSDNDLNNILARNTKRSVFIPLELTNSELITLAAATSLGIVAFKNDQEISNVIEKNQSQVATTISTVGNFYGSTAPFIIAAGSYFMGAVYENNKLKKVGLFIIEAELAQAIITDAVKVSAGRLRPNADSGPYEFFTDSGRSFWSGHTATAFTFATVVSEMYKDEYPIVPYVSYGLAAITAYARVHDDKHWASDVIMGAVSGYLIAKLSMSSLTHDGKRGGFTFYPSYDASTGTIMANLNWTPKEKESASKCSKMPDGEAKIHACFEEALNKKH